MPIGATTCQQSAYVTLQQQIDSAVATGSELVDNILRVYQQTITDLPFKHNLRQTAKPTVSD